MFTEIGIESFFYIYIYILGGCAWIKKNRLKLLIYRYYKVKNHNNKYYILYNEILNEVYCLDLKFKV